MTDQALFPPRAAPANTGADWPKLARLIRATLAPRPQAPRLRRDAGLPPEQPDPREAALRRIALHGHP